MSSLVIEQAALRSAVDVFGAAERLSIGATLVKRLIRDGELRAVKIGRRTVIPITEIDAYLQRELEAAGR